MQKTIDSMACRHFSAQTRVMTMQRRRSRDAVRRESETIALICSIGPTRNIILQKRGRGEDKKEVSDASIFSSASQGSIESTNFAMPAH